MDRRQSKYKAIADDLRSRIHAGAYRAGAQLPAEQALAAEYAVTHVTLRKALKVLAEEGLVVRRHGAGTFVRRECRETGVQPGLVLYVGDPVSHFYRDLYLEHVRVAQQRDLRLTTHLVPSGAIEDESRLAQQLEAAPAVVCQVDVLPTVLQFMDPCAKTLVVLGTECPRVGRTPCHCVGSSWQEASRRAFEHLFAVGHRRVAYVSGPDDAVPGKPYGWPSPTRHGYMGYRAAMAFCRGAQEIVAGVIGSDNEDTENRIAAWLDDQDPWPSAFWCEGDYLAAAILRVAERKGRSAPDDFSLIGLGNTPWCEMLSPALTSISFGEARLARVAMALALSEPPGEPSLVTVEPHLVERASVAPPPPAGS